MANPTTPRLTPAELRKRLLSPPVDTTAPVVPDQSTPAPAPRVPPRRDNRYGSGGTQSAIDLEALVAEVTPAQNPRITPLPESRLEPRQFRTQQEAAPAPAATYPTVPGSNYGDTDTLRAQNAELHRIVEEMKPLLEEATASEQRFSEKEHQLLAQMAELQEVVARLEEQIATAPVPKTPKTRDELEEWSDELEQESAKIAQERRRMDDDRRQLQEDEEALEKQMRDMEVAMARERAMIARQETELKRLSSEIQHELEVLQRGDGTLREQLSKFERRRQEVLSNAPRTATPLPAPVHTPAPVPPPPVTAPGARDSGLLRRIFRGGK